jgi:hypothetical protein
VAGESELKVLDILSKKLLARPREVKAAFGRPDGIDAILSGLIATECIQVVEPMGEKCFVITHKGTKILQDAKDAGWKTEAQAHQGSF